MRNDLYITVLRHARNLAHERPLAFAGNDRPGVMLASAIRAYIGQYAVLPGGLFKSKSTVFVCHQEG